MAKGWTKQFCVRGHDTFVVGRTNSRNCRACFNERNSRRRKANPERNVAYVRRARYAKLYGITPEDYDRMAEEQDGLCALCGGNEPTSRRLAVDHGDSGTRRLLCSPCNMGIGLLLEDSHLLEIAIAYLAAHA